MALIPAAQTAVPRWLRAWPASLLLLGLAVAATYLHTLEVPFYLDDYSSILENDLVYRWQGFGPIWRVAPMRLLCYASFALNHRLGAFDPVGYHLVNIVVHFLAGVAVFALVRGLLRTPRMADAGSRPLIAGLPLVAAALFLLHPLQTQAVTYVVQRLASLAAMFYLSALACYVQARLSPRWSGRLLWGSASLSLALLALFSKENAATLPLAIVLVEFACFRHERRSGSRLALGAIGSLALVWLLAALAFQGNPLSLRSMGQVASQSATISRESYLATQLPILWTYLRLFLWPVGLHLDYPSGPLRHFTEVTPWLALGGHLVVIALALVAWRTRPLATFGALFYYLGHAVESSVIPIPELAFEHRAYLPNAGLCLVAGWALLAELPRWSRGTRPAAAATLLVLGVLAVMTWQRNQLWRDPVAFWRDNTERAPTKARGWGNLGKHLVLAGRAGEGEGALRESMRLHAVAGDEVEPLDVVNLAMALQALGRDREALALVEHQLEVPRLGSARAMLLLSKGNILFREGRLVEAEESFGNALRILPHSLPVQINLASTLAQMGRFAEAESLYRSVLAADPDDADVRTNLLQTRVGRLREESKAFRSNDPARAERARRAALATLEELVRRNPADSLMRRNLERARSEGVREGR
ncbi:MAG: tetratricopeptide repeat protein [Candidatus Eiseniibacteriota bacterium]